MKKRNIILTSDYYKSTHHKQYPKDTKIVYSYGESRGGKFPATLFFGLQAFIHEYMEGVIVEQWMIEEADKFLKRGFGFDYFNREGWQRIIDVHGGKLPIKIRAVQEGTIVPTNNVLFTIENTDEELPWLTNFIETSLLRGIWYPTTVATLSYNIKKSINDFCIKTGCEISPFHLNDFGARGVSSGESAGLGGMAHLINFLGTDTIEGILAAQKYYNADVCGYSVMASEHSTTTIYGKEYELQAYQHFLDNCPDEATLSVVIDSYDTENAVKNLLGGALKDKILARKGKVVFRPDSGDPVEISLSIVQWLWDIFGGTINEKGYKILDPHVGIIYGDSMNYENISKVLENFANHQFAASNIVFGSGGALIQSVNRDTQKFAIKCSAAKRGDNWIHVFKDPITDHGKRSKKGRLALVRYDNNEYTTVPEELARDEDNLLIPIFENGVLLKKYTFDEVRNTAKL